MRTHRTLLALLVLTLPVLAQDKYRNAQLGIRYNGLYGWESKKAAASGVWTELVRYTNHDLQAVVVLLVRNNPYATSRALRDALEEEFKEGGEPGPDKTVYKDRTIRDAEMKGGDKLFAVEVAVTATRVTEEGKRRERREVIRTYFGRNRLFRIHCSVRRVRANRVLDTHFKRALAGLVVSGTDDEKVARGTPFRSARGRYSCIVPEGYTTVLPGKASYDVYFENRKAGVRVLLYGYAYDGTLLDHQDEMVEYYGDALSEPREEQVLGGPGFTATVTKGDQVTLVAATLRNDRVYRVHTRTTKGNEKEAARVHAEVMKSFRMGR